MRVSIELGRNLPSKLSPIINFHGIIQTTFPQLHELYVSYLLGHNLWQNVHGLPCTPHKNPNPRPVSGMESNMDPFLKHCLRGVFSLCSAILLDSCAHNSIENCNVSLEDMQGVIVTHAFFLPKYLAHFGWRILYFVRLK